MTTQRTSRRCLFCGEPAGSAEHAFPDWLNQIFKYDEPSEATVTTHDFATGDKTSRRYTAKQIASTRVKWVCHDCNTGWMSRLEGRAKPLLTPMITGLDARLSDVEQILVATWAVKTVMVLEPTLGGNRAHYFSAEDCRIVMAEQRPPGYVRVRSAAIESEIGPLRYACARGHAERDDDPLFEFHIYTLQIGTLVLQTLRPAPPPPSYGALKAFAIPDDIEIPVFPPVARFAWPPDAVLDEEGFSRFTARLAEVGGPG